MDFARLGQGERVAGVSGVLLVVFMFAFNWFGLKLEAGVVALPNEITGDAWGSYDFTDIVLFISALAAIGLALLAASEREVRLPAASAIVAGLGLLSVLLVVISIISPPNLGGVDVSGPGIDHERKIGVWLGLIAAAGVAAGGYMAMREEETSSGPSPPTP